MTHTLQPPQIRFDSSYPKLFGIYNELVLLLIAVFLTAVVGGLAGYYFQKKSFEHQNSIKAKETEAAKAADIKEREIAKASEVFDELSRTLDRRAFRTKRLFWAYKNNHSINETERERKAYEAALFEWNENLNRTYALTQKYFGDEMRRLLEVHISKRFIFIHAALEEYRIQNDPSVLLNIENPLLTKTGCSSHSGFIGVF